MTYQLGYEIEFCGLTSNEISEAFAAAEVPYAGRYSYHGSRGAIASEGPGEGMRIPNLRDSKEYGPANPNASVWVTEHDGSLRNTAGRGGCHEVISPFLYGRAGMDEARKVHKALVAAGAQTNSSCGNHISMGVGHNSRWARFSQKRKAEVGGRIAWIYAHFQPVFDALSSNTRQSTNNCYTSGVNATRPFTGRGVVNARTFVMTGKVEFRQPGYTLDWKNIEGWTMILQSIVSCAMNENHRSHVKGWRNFVEDLVRQPISIDNMLRFLNPGRIASRWAHDRLVSNIHKWSQGREQRVQIRNQTYNRPSALLGMRAFWFNGETNIRRWD